VAKLVGDAYDEEMRIRVGLCGFTMAMEDYALQFPVVEIQHTFYEPPAADVMRRWADGHAVVS
jgi:uncharacterized protein YecE (DUF72 family)